MPQYNYTGKLVDGTETSGLIKASDETHLEQLLIDKGMFLESYRVSTSRFKELSLKLFKKSEITKITRQINILLDSGISILEALELSYEQSKDRTLQIILQDVINQVESGKSIASSFNRYPLIFDSMYISMIDVGELSGRIDLAFDRIASYREKSEETTKKITSALTYPILVIFVAIFVVFALILYVVPVFSSMYANFGAELPQLTQYVVSFSDGLKNSFWYWMILLLLSIVGSGFVWFSEKFKLYLDKVLVKIPLIKNLVMKIISARFCRTLGSLLTSGVDIIYAFQVAVKTTGNKYVIQKLEPAEIHLTQGKSLTEAIETASLFPKAMLRMTASGEKTGRLGEMLLKSAEYYEKESDSEIKTLTTLIEPLIIIILGVFVAFILIAMYLPLFDLVGTI